MCVHKYLNNNLVVSDIPLSDINSMFFEFFFRKDYEWWYQVQKGDIVVDIGACVGFFTCLALDGGASKIYSIEPNKNHLKTLLVNTSNYHIEHGTTPVIPVHAAIGKESRDTYNIFGNDQKVPMLSFLDFIKKYEITHIDYLKIDAEGAEYNILIEENFEFLRNKVKHMSIEFHLNCFREAPYEWIHFRDGMLRRFDLDKVRFLRHDERQYSYDDNLLLSKWPLPWGNNSFMLYISNS